MSCISLIFSFYFWPWQTQSIVVVERRCKGFGLVFRKGADLDLSRSIWLTFHQTIWDLDSGPIEFCVRPCETGGFDVIPTALSYQTIIPVNDICQWKLFRLYCTLWRYACCKLMRSSLVSLAQAETDRDDPLWYHSRYQRAKKRSRDQEGVMFAISKVWNDPTMVKKDIIRFEAKSWP